MEGYWVILEADGRRWTTIYYEDVIAARKAGKVRVFKCNGTLSTECL